MIRGEVLPVGAPQLAERVELPNDILRRLRSTVPHLADDRPNLFVSVVEGEIEAALELVLAAPTLTVVALRLLDR